MPGSNKTYNVKNAVAAILMAITLLWLTISIPFVNAAQQRQAALVKVSHAQDTEDCNPFANTTEEKTPSSLNLSEEYLHGHEEQIQISCNKLNHTHTHSFDVYVAFHGELLSPPPDL